MNKRYWLIRGYDSGKRIFEKRVKLGDFTENQIQHLLQMLAAKGGLNYEEIFGAHAKSGSSIRNNLLAVHKNFDPPTWMCGSNPHFTASIVDQEGKIIASPKAQKLT